MPNYILKRLFFGFLVWMVLYLGWHMYRINQPSYIQKYATSNAERIRLSRPGFHQVAHYDSSWSFRPAQSPVIKKKDRLGRTYHHGDYHLFGHVPDEL
ncbi:hypothetical protein BT69DRAFT_1277784 [Atractiella rhizophila]|nr:hypothetical protein BT69DRAFT_1277784 [Atractiella rhizophila]